LTATAAPLHPSRRAVWPRLVGYDASRWCGQALRDARTRASVSPEYLAHLLGRSVRTIARWETNQTSPSPEEALVLAALLGVALGVFFAPASPAEGRSG